ncbi:MAG TPA: D-glycero-beta-D-manno-heptose-7-phosphate kinase [Candidatus Nanoarchaeia archaeon]|nr:D-glycero-beta-D-manno-heptose-7-phosphate kinase [Candidatus Nanoarchaeia archaeon]
MEQIKQKLLNILKNFKGKRILVLGDVMLDKYIWGEVTRISPEAPVQVVNVINETNSPGGAANVAANVSSLGGTATMVGIVGQDHSKNTLIEELKKNKIDTSGILTDKDKPTIQKIRVMGRGQQLIRVDYESKEHVHKSIESSIISFAEKNIKNVDCVVMSDYSKGVITENTSQKIIELANKNKKPVVIDPKPSHKRLYKNATLITPNLLEANGMAGSEDFDDKDIKKTGQKLVSELSSSVLITRSEKGMSLFEKNGKVTELKANKREVFSIIGAGDTVVATIALALSAGADLKDACYLSNIAAGIKVGKIGTASVSIDEIKKEIESLKD